MLISLSELPEVLRKHVTTFRDCVKLALNDFARDHTPLRVRYSTRTEASIIHDYMVWYAKDRFPWRLKRNLFLIKLEEFRAKLKKLDGKWRTRSIPTQLALDFERQRPARLFDDLDVTNLFLGYQRDDAELMKSRIWLVCPDGRSFKWIAELTAEEGSGTMEFAASIPTDPMADAPGRRIKRKQAEEKEKDGRPRVNIKE